MEHMAEQGEKIPQKTIERLAFYRHILLRAKDEGKIHLFSHEIAEIAGTTSAQVRRDLMEVGYLGHPRHGYEVVGLLAKLNEFFKADEGIRMVLVGVGNLGRAILAYFSGRVTNFTMVASFEKDPTKVGRVLHGVHCHSIEQIPEIVASANVDVGILAVPESEAQPVAEMLVKAGVRGLMNLAPTRVKVPSHVFVENVELALAIEKVGFFSRLQPVKKGEPIVSA